jgi:hypothetical protein
MRRARAKVGASSAVVDDVVDDEEASALASV